MTLESRVTKLENSLDQLIKITQNIAASIAVQNNLAVQSQVKLHEIEDKLNGLIGFVQGEKN